MADIEISYESRQVLQAKRDIQDLEKSFNAAYKSAQVFESAFARTEKMNNYINSLNQVAAANQRIINQNLGVTNSYKSAEESAESFTQILKNQEIQAKKFTESFNERSGITGYYKSAADSAQVFQAAAKRESDAWFAQQRRRLAMMRESERIAELQTMATNRSAGAFGRFGFAAQQAGYQVGDFFVQIQSGTNAFVAFGQQATQLAGLLTLSMNPAVMAWGVALSIVIPLLTAAGAAWSRTTEKTQDYKKPLEEVLEITRQIREETDKIQFPDPTVKVIGSLEEQLKDAEKNLAKIDEQVRSLASAGALTGGSMFAFAFQESDLDLVRREAEIKLETLREEIRLRDLLKQRENARQAEGAAQLAKLKAERDAQVKTQEQMNDRLTLGKNLFHAMAGETSSVSMYLNDALRAALGLANVDFSNIKNVAYFLSIYQGQMGRGRTAPGGPVFHYPLNADTRFGPSFEGSGRGGLPPALPNQPTLEELFGDTGGGTGGGGTGGAATENTIAQLQKQLNLEQELLGTSEAYQRVRQALGDDFAKTQPQVIDGLVAQIEAVEQLKKVEEDRKKLMDTVKSSLEDSFMSMVDGTKSVKDAFRDMARDIIKELYRVLVVQRLVNSISGAIGGAFGIPTTAQANGGVWSGGTQIKAYANGGVVGSPTYFPMANGRTGLMGEAGPEAIMPLKRGPDGKLGVQASGGGNVTVNNVINISGTGDGAYVRSEISKALPQIVGATKSAVIDARRRGGQMASAFS